MKLNTLYGVLLCSCIALLTGCEPQNAAVNAQVTAAPKPAAKAALKILSGSENRALDPVLKEFTRETGIPVNLEERGSVDIMLLLQQPKLDYHAVWPASGIWLDVSGNKNLGERVSIYRTPVVLGVKESTWARLQLGNELSLEDFSKLLQSGKLSLIASNPTQSNSGAMAYLAFLHQLVGKDDPMQPEDLDSAVVQSKVKTLFAHIQRMAGSSSWLKDLYLAPTQSGNSAAMSLEPPTYDAMINYEATVIELNTQLVAQKADPLHVIYITGATAMADSPLTYLKGSDDRAADVKKLQEFLTRPAIQQRLIDMGRRTGLAEISSPTFNSAWGLDTKRLLQPFPIPTVETIRKALQLYQTELKRPTLTIYVLDYSGSMHDNGGEMQLRNAMTLLLTPDESSKYLLNTGRHDLTWVQPFNSSPMKLMATQGSNPQDILGVRDELLSLNAGGGTDFYTAMHNVIVKLKTIVDLEDYQVAIILMTDGQSQGDQASFLQFYKGQVNQIPIYAVTFGEADLNQLNVLAKTSRGRIFDGRKSLIKALREAKSYN